MDLRLLRPPVDNSRTRGQCSHNGWPRLLRGAVQHHAQPADAEISRQLQISLAVANHRAVGQIYIALTDEVADEAGPGLAAIATVRGKVRADEFPVERDPLRLKGRENEVVRQLKGFPRERRCTQAILVGN